MDLQNILLCLSVSEVKAYYQNKSYNIPNVTNLAALQTELDAQSGSSVETAVVQYTVDQYGEGAEPRIVFNDGSFAALDSISTGLSDQLAITRTEVETEINNQIA